MAKIFKKKCSNQELEEGSFRFLMTLRGLLVIRLRFYSTFKFVNLVVLMQFFKSKTGKTTFEEEKIEIIALV